MRSTTCWQLPLLVLVLAPPSVAPGVEISECDREGRAHFRIETERATWYYDRAGGGFSGLVDRDGNDWIAFKKDPLSTYPDSAAAGYRGLPNAVFVGPDKGAGHPGFDRCVSTASGNAIQTKSISGKWAWSWEFVDEQATFTMQQADPAAAWWFLYEGPIGGTFSPTTKFWGTDTGGPRHEAPNSSDQLFDQWRWIYFGDRDGSRVLLLVQQQADQLPDTLWYLGSSQRGSATAPDGMVVFGFGRGPRTTPRLQHAGHRFTVALVEATDHSQIAERARSILPD